MNRLLAMLVAATLILAAVPGGAVAASTDTCSFPITKTDSTDTEVTIDAAPDRVVVLAPSAAQTMWEIGGTDQVVGLPVTYSSYLDGAADRTDVMADDGFTVDVEQVIYLEPDLVLAPNIVPTETVAKLRDAGITVYRFGPAGTIEDVKTKTLLTGELTGNCEGAHDTVDWMESELDTVRETLEGNERPSVYVPLGGGYTAGSGTFIDDVVTTAGGENIAAANISFYGTISNEVILDQDPDWILIQDTLGMPDNPVLNETTAGQKGQFVTVDTNYISQPAPRVVHVVVTIAKTLHPDAYAAANATPTRTEEPTTTVATTEEPTTAVATTEEPDTTTAPASEETPGFGVVPVIVALLAVALLARRR